VLKLGYPIKAQGRSTTLKQDACPHAQSVKMIFPSRPNLPMMAMPEVEVNWYDGGFRGEIPDQPLPEGRTWQGEGCAIYGSKDTLVLGSHGGNAYLLSGRVPDSPAVLRVIPDDNHYLDWVAACKDPDLRDKTASHFAEAGPFNEMVLMGVLAVRLQNLTRVLHWDGENMEFTNIADDEMVSAYAISRDQRQAMMEAAQQAAAAAGETAGGPGGFGGFGGSMANDPSSVNAREHMAELVSHTYRNGFSLPAMPA
jgi:hypothetical protein